MDMAVVKAAVERLSAQQKVELICAAIPGIGVHELRVIKAMTDARLIALAPPVPEPRFPFSGTRPGPEDFRVGESVEFRFRDSGPLIQGQVTRVNVKRLTVARYLPDGTLASRNSGRGNEFLMPPSTLRRIPRPETKVAAPPALPGHRASFPMGGSMVTPADMATRSFVPSAPGAGRF